MELGSFCGYDATLEDDGILVITFNQPERYNGMTMALKRDLRETLEQAQGDDRVWTIVFTGMGKAFCAGDDPALSFFGQSPKQVPAQKWPGKQGPLRNYGMLRTLMSELTRVVRSSDKLTIAAINGYAIQSGLSLALACDFRIASSEAKLGSATLRFGYQPDEGGHYLLVQHLGVSRAMEFMMRKRIVPAEEALRLGLVNQVVEPADLMEQTRALARELHEGPQLAMRLLKRSIYNAAHQTMGEALDDIAVRTAISDNHADAHEGRDAWLQKRPAVFNRWLMEDE